MSQDRDLNDELDEAIGNGKRNICLEMPTGSGKHLVLARVAAKAQVDGRMLFISGHPAVAAIAIQTIREMAPTLSVSQDLASDADVVVISMRKADRLTRGKSLVSGFSTLWLGERHPVLDHIARRIAAPLVSDSNIRIVDESEPSRSVFEEPDARIGHGSSDYDSFKQTYGIPGSTGP